MDWGPISTELVVSLDMSKWYFDTLRANITNHLNVDLIPVLRHLSEQTDTRDLVFSRYVKLFYLWIVRLWLNIIGDLTNVYCDLLVYAAPQFEAKSFFRDMAECSLKLK